MKVLQAGIARFAFIDDRGVLTVRGPLAAIRLHASPDDSPFIFVWAELQLEYEDRGLPKPVLLSVGTYGGNIPWATSADMRYPDLATALVPNPIKLNLRVPRARFSRPGVYYLTLLVDDRVVHAMTLQVKR